jgi:hypothetical protein
MAFVIGVAGQAQHGKDTLSDRLAEKLNEKIGFRSGGDKWTHNFDHLWTRVAFAENVKKVYEDTFGKTREFVEEWKVKPESPPDFDMTVRKSLQFIGDGFRKICPTIWMDLVFRRAVGPIIISDVRYVNEFLRVKEEGGMNILVGRTALLNDDPNGSEAQIRPYVKYCLDRFGGKDKPDVVQLKHYSHDGPEHMDKFDLFVKNDNTLEYFLEVVETHVVPIVEGFVFQFDEEETEPLEAELVPE